LLKAHVSFAFETVGSTEEKLDFIKKVKGDGYRIDLIYVTLNDPQLCLERIKERVSKGGHDVDPEKVIARYKRSMNNLYKFVELADTAMIVDNSNETEIIFFESGTKCGILNVEQYKWIDKYIDRLKGIKKFTKSEDMFSFVLHQ
jgi:Uncharacterized protein conserved in bacteria